MAPAEAAARATDGGPRRSIRRGGEREGSGTAYDLEPAATAAIDALLEVVRDRHGEALAGVIVYGSFLRGKRDTLIDLYVLLSRFDGAMPRRWHGWGAAVLPPNVYYLSTTDASSGEVVRSKCSVMRLDQLERAVERDFHPYFWARFCQPQLIAFAADDLVRGRLERVAATAAGTFLANVLPELPAGVDAATAWRRGFELTYRCELRPESPQSAHDLYTQNRAYFDRVFVSRPLGRRSGLGSWRLRRWVGRTLAALRVIKAGATFEDPLDYVVWKTSRHSGVRVEPSPLARRYPLIFGWPVLWRMYRRGAFR